MPGPPPPPPLPGMGRGAGGPPPPPGGPPSFGKAPAKGAGRGALLGSIQQGTRLKKVSVVNDRSAPTVGTVSNGPAAPKMGSAPPIPGMASRPPPASLAPPPPSGSRGRSNSDGGEGEGSHGGPPQLAGILAGGMPKLRKTGGKIDTGANTHSPYLSDPETLRAAPRPPAGSAPKPPSAPRVPGSAPPLPGSSPSIASVAQLRANLRPSSMVSTSSSISLKPKPAPPIGKKPPVPPPSSRKPSQSSISISTPASAPPPPPGAAPRPPVRSTPLPPATTGPSGPSLAEQAARNAFNRSSPAAPPPPRRTSSPPAKSYQDDDYDPYNYSNGSPRGSVSSHAPPPRPLSAAPPPPPSAAPSAPSVRPSPPSSAPRPSGTAQTYNSPVRSMLDISTSQLRPKPSNASIHTLGSNGNRSSSMTMSTTRTNSSYMSHDTAKPLVKIQDSRWRFQDESQFPKPREFSGVAKKYRAGRISSVPLDLAAYEQ